MGRPQALHEIQTPPLVFKGLRIFMLIHDWENIFFFFKTENNDISLIAIPILILICIVTLLICPEAEFKEFEPRLKYGWFHLKMYQMFKD